jgi:hypothetical protein
MILSSWEIEIDVCDVDKSRRHPLRMAKEVSVRLRLESAGQDKLPVRYRRLRVYVVKGSLDVICPNDINS